MPNADSTPGSPPGPPDIGSAAVPRTAVGWWALGLSVVGLGAWIVLPAITAAFGEKYPITNSGLMPVLGTVLIVVAAVFNVLCLWLWKERSALNVAAAVVTIPAALFLGFMVVGQSIGGDSGIPDTTADVAFATIERSTRNGKVVVVLLKADPEAANKIGRPADSKYRAASVRIDQNTAIVNGETIDDVLAAKHLDVWFTGPVAESDPVQATAGTVVINKD